MPETVSDHVVRILLDWGVDTVFGLPGDGINGLVEAFRKAGSKLRYVHVRHEEAAALAACAYAKFSGRLGVCFSTAAPGAVHLLNGLYDAKIDGAPVLAITGMTYHDLIGTHYLQDINQDYLFQDVALYNQRLMGPEHLENVLNLACRAALSNRAVAHVAIPIDIQAMPASAERRFKRNVKGHVATHYQVPVRIPERYQIEAAAEALAGCKKTVILAGAGARGAGAELEQLAERLAAVIIKPLLGKDCVADTSPYTTGGIGVVGTRPSVEAIARLRRPADRRLLLSLYRIPAQARPGRWRADRRQARAYRPALPGRYRPRRRFPRHPARTPVQAAAQRGSRLPHPRPGKHEILVGLDGGTRHLRSPADVPASRQLEPARPARRRTRSSAAIPARVTTWAARMSCAPGQLFSFSGTMCSMMAAIPTRSAPPTPSRTARSSPLPATARHHDHGRTRRPSSQHKLPVKIVVMKNNTLGLIKWEQMLYLGNPEYGVDLHPVDFVKVAEGCGLRGVRIENPEHCRDQLKNALAMDGPVLIECVVDPLEPPWPPGDHVRRTEETCCRDGARRAQPHPDRPDHGPPRGAGIQLQPKPVRRGGTAGGAGHRTQAGNHRKRPERPRDEPGDES